MPQFILLCRDKPGAAGLRQETRPDHLAYIKSAGEKVRLAGPMLDKEGGPDSAPTGSMLIIEAADQAEADAFAKADPYARAGLFEEVRVIPYRLVAGALLSRPNDK
ncbi:MAG: YciI family protein [Pseudomonadota bacterium]